MYRWYELMTLTFDLGGHDACDWCGSSSSIRIPRLKFVGLAVRKIWPTMCVSINRPGDPALWPFDLETGMRVASKIGNLRSKFWHARPSGSRIIRYVRDGQTDGRTKATLIAVAPSLRVRGIITSPITSASQCTQTRNKESKEVNLTRCWRVTSLNNNAQFDTNVIHTSQE